MGSSFELAVAEAIAGGLRPHEALAIMASVEEALALLGRLEESEGVKP